PLQAALHDARSDYDSRHLLHRLRPAGQASGDYATAGHDVVRGLWHSWSHLAGQQQECGCSSEIMAVPLSVGQ
ncbi:MAG: hypothetical protein QGD91_12555, partial [Actinomycetota bacterium]|nr:hypothetical protein [Actinomycetota bacterium]